MSENSGGKELMYSKEMLFTRSCSSHWYKSENHNNEEKIILNRFIHHF